MGIRIRGRGSKDKGFVGIVTSRTRRADSWAEEENSQTYIQTEMHEGVSKDRHTNGRKVKKVGDDAEIQAYRQEDKDRRRYRGTNTAIYANRQTDARRT